MVTSMLTAAALALTLAATLPSCSKDDDDKSNDEELYKPSENMTSSEIQALLEEVADQMATVRQVAIEGKKTADDKTPYWEIRAQVDIDAKKEVIEQYESGTMLYITYVEDFAGYYSNSNFKKSYKVSDAYWSWSATVAHAVEEFEAFKKLELKWKVEGSTFVGSATSSYHTEKMTVTLTKDKKLADFKIESVDIAASTTHVSELKYAYSGVNPALPSGFSKSDFPPVSQYSIKVVWGEGLGESTFYTEPNSSYIYPSNITSYAPKVEGKTPALYFDDEFTQPFTSSKTVSNSNLVIYVKWVANTSERAWNVGKSSRASILMEKNHR